MRGAVLLGAVLFAAIMSGCPKRVVPPPMAIGSSLDLTVRSYPEGQWFRLSDQRGQVVLLEVWATWCAPCRQVLPFYQQLQDKYGPMGLRVYALSLDEDPSQIPPFLEETRIGLPILVDPLEEVSEGVLHVRLMPTSYLVDRRGIVRHIHEGLSPNEIHQLSAEIEQLLKEPSS